VSSNGSCDKDCQIRTGLVKLIVCLEEASVKNKHISLALVVRLYESTTLYSAELWPTKAARAMFKLTVESLLRQPVLAHTDDVSGPAKLR